MGLMRKTVLVADFFVTVDFAPIQFLTAATTSGTALMVLMKVTAPP